MTETKKRKLRPSDVDKAFQAGRAEGRWEAFKEAIAICEECMPGRPLQARAEVSHIRNQIVLAMVGERPNGR